MTSSPVVLRSLESRLSGMKRGRRTAAVSVRSGDRGGGDLVSLRRWLAVAA
jgi:hypothetical protein